MIINFKQCKQANRQVHEKLATQAKKVKIENENEKSALITNTTYLLFSSQIKFCCRIVKMAGQSFCNGLTTYLEDHFRQK